MNEMTLDRIKAAAKIRKEEVGEDDFIVRQVEVLVEHIEQQKNLPVQIAEQFRKERVAYSDANEVKPELYYLLLSLIYD